MAGMSIFNIAKWENNDSLKHVATTWQIAKDINFEDLVYEEERSTEHLTFLKINLAIPTGQIYYIRAKRHFEDANGNEVENNTWIGPEPIIDNSSAILEPLKPKVYIEEPYIKDFTVDAENGLTINVLEPKDGVGILGTDWIIMVDGNVVFSELNKTDNPFTITVSNDIYNFTAVDKITVFIRYRGQLGKVSKLFKDEIELVRNKYKFLSNLTDIPVDRQVTLEFEILDSNVRISAVNILNMDKSLVVTPTLEDNKITFDGSLLEPNKSYILSLLLQFVDNENKLQTSIETLYLKTVKLSENKVFNHSLNVENKFTLLKEDDYTNVNINDVVFYTEQFITGHVPLPNKDSKLDYNLLTINDSLTIDLIKSLDIDLTNVIRIELLSNFNVMFVKETDNSMVIDFYKFNVLDESLTYIKTLNLPISKQEVLNNNIFEFNKEILVVGKKPDTDNEVSVYKTSIDELSDFTLIKDFKLVNSKTVNTVVASLIDNDTILILPVGENVGIKSYLIDLTKEDIFEGPTISEDFRNLDLRSVWLKNGNVVYFKHDDDGQFMVFDFKQSDFTVFDTTNNAGKGYSGIIKLKGIGIITYLVNNDKIRFYYYR